jgi:ribose transport system ATP-binding protein
MPVGGQPGLITRSDHTREASPSDQSPVLELAGISKRFPGVQALDDVSLTLLRGEIHGLVGENGAGKSTLLKVIGGVVQPDQGKLIVRGHHVRISDPLQAQRLGIAFIHQELALFPNLDVASNIFIAELPRSVPGVVDFATLRDRARTVLARVGLEHIDPAQRVASLRPGEQQLVEIARCLAQRTEILVLDEPTSSLTEREIETLFSIIRELRAQGVSVLYVSHRLDEVFELCDRVTVLRDGRRVDTCPIVAVDRPALVRMMLGHDLAPRTRGVASTIGPTLLRVEGLSRGRVLQNVSFELHRGEILGIIGVLGSGRTELARCLFGLDQPDSGKVEIDGVEVRVRQPSDAIQLGVGFITEDRRAEGLSVDDTIVDNVVMASLRTFATKVGWMRRGGELVAAERQRDQLRIATPSVLRLVRYLSGGNQQKVVLAKWLETKPRIFILDEPTRGIDVGTKEELYTLIQELAADGAGIILISSEVPEIVRLADRVLVMRAGRIVTELRGSDISPQSVLLATVGGVH